MVKRPSKAKKKNTSPQQSNDDKNKETNFTKTKGTIIKKDYQKNED